MQASSYKSAKQFLELYADRLPAGTILEIGSRLVSDGQRTLRNICPRHHQYFGVDLEAGINVDVVLANSYEIPFADDTVDIVLCTSVFEHSAFFWKLFEELARVLKPGGLIYLNAPSNGYVHRYPVDCWRFYPDSGVALAEWGRSQGHDLVLLESFVTDQDLSENPEEIWNDFVAIFLKGANLIDLHPHRLTEQRQDYVNARFLEQEELLKAHRFSGRSHDETVRWQQAQNKNSGRAKIYQVIYSEQTQAVVPAGILPLDNLENERPDWAEYWPIRRFLMNEELDENVLYGFISPRFSEKTLLPVEALLEFVLSVSPDVDVAAFSPFFDFRAIFRNVFEQAEFSHPGMMDLCQEVIDEVLPNVDLRQVINTSVSGIFCNYFAAKPRFWREWLAICERIFQIAETESHPLAAKLNRTYFYRKAPTPAKVFIVERIASLLLATRSEFNVQKFSKSTLTRSLSELPYALFSTMDSLKTQALEGHDVLLGAYLDIQRNLLSSEFLQKERKRFLVENIKFDPSNVPSRGYEHWGSLVTPPQGKPATSGGLGWLLGRLLR